jgi:hypothetical protein
MKPEELYQELKLAAQRLGVAVEEHNFREAGVRVVSGLCVVHGKRLFMDKHKSVQKKIRSERRCLKCRSTSLHYPAVRNSSQNTPMNPAEGG